MKKQKRAESLVSVVIAVSILSFALLWIFNILSFNKNIGNSYARDINTFILNSNIKNITKKLNTDSLPAGQKFYLEKDTVHKKYTISSNPNKKFVNKLGENVDKDNNLWKSYTVELEKKDDLLKYTNSPTDIGNMHVWLDAKSLVDQWKTNGEEIQIWENNPEISNGIYAERAIIEGTKLDTSGINGVPALKFEWDAMMIIENDTSTFFSTTYEKSYAITFKTSEEIKKKQVIFEMWLVWNGYILYIENGKMHFFYDGSFTTHSEGVELINVFPFTTYHVIVVHDAKYIDQTKNNIKIYVNGVKAGQIDNVTPSSWILWEWWIWWANGSSADLSVLRFNGMIWEFMIWNKPISSVDVQSLQNNFERKWGTKIEKINYNFIDVDVKEYNF